MNQEDKILFSIIIPTYNRAHLISKAIQSVLDQTYTHWELVIVDDGSTDNTEEVVRKFNDQRIRYFQKNHEERSVARNFGIEKSSGLNISFLDDDDYYLAEFLEEFNRKIEKEKRPIGYFMCLDYTEINGKKTLSQVKKDHLKNPTEMIWINQRVFNSFVFHKNIFVEFKFIKNCLFGEDLEFLMNVSLKYPFYFIERALCVYCNHEFQSTSVETDYENKAENYFYCFSRILENNQEIFKKIPEKKIFDRINHVVYAFASIAMKKKDFKFFKLMIKKIDFRGSWYKTLYYFISLIIRFPYYWI